MAHLHRPRRPLLKGKACTYAALPLLFAHTRITWWSLMVPADDDDEFEARLAALKKAKGETPYGASGRSAVILVGSARCSLLAPSLCQHDLAPVHLHACHLSEK